MSAPTLTQPPPCAPGDAGPPAGGERPKVGDQIDDVLEANLAISTALPCRISVYEEGGITKLATIKPTTMIALYASPELKGVAEDVETTLERIMREAAR